MLYWFSVVHCFSRQWAGEDGAGRTLSFIYSSQQHSGQVQNEKCLLQTVMVLYTNDEDLQSWIQSQNGWPTGIVMHIQYCGVRVRVGLWWSSFFRVPVRLAQCHCCIITLLMRCRDLWQCKLTALQVVVLNLNLKRPVYLVAVVTDLVPQTLNPFSMIDENLNVAFDSERSHRFARDNQLALSEKL